MTSCLDDDTLLDVAEGRRGMDAEAERHLAACADCRRLIAAIARGAGATLEDTSASCDVVSSPDGEPAWDELGQGVVVGGCYRLEAFLGAGGMGVVWRARRTDDGVQVALKTTRGCEPALDVRFEREARVLTALQHPHIVRVLETLPPTGTRGPVIVQELLEGESLEVKLARVRALPLAEACRTMIPIASAVRAAHDRGIVHRDLKPANVFLTVHGRVVVLDFGIAKLLPSWGTHTKLTRTGAVVGSPRYMAPEQLFGEAADARADVWALGAMLFRFLSGRGPVEADSVGETMKALAVGAIGDMGELVSGLPDDVLGLARAALTVDRQRRLADVGSFERVLARYAT
jgi:eukaryotic-like serine/threonine-protein kinase